jgi:hypothetical protein
MSDSGQKMTTINPYNSFPGCGRCKHLIANRPGRWSCKAFPDGIPMIIASGTWDHREPFPDDNGIRFEPRSNP